MTKSSFWLCQLIWQCDKTAPTSIWRWQEHNDYYLEACVSGWCAHPEENTYMWKSSLHHRNICCQDYVAFEYSSSPVWVWVEEGECSAVEGNTKDGLLWPESASVVRGDIISATTITITITTTITKVSESENLFGLRRSPHSLRCKPGIDIEANTCRSDDVANVEIVAKYWQCW